MKKKNVIISAISAILFLGKLRFAFIHHTFIIFNDGMANRAKSLQCDAIKIMLIEFQMKRNTISRAHYCTSAFLWLLSL